MSVECKNEAELGKLKKLYNHALTRSCGHTVKYRGYTPEKVDWSHPDHSEYSIRNQEGKVVESYTVTAFDSPEALKQRLDELVNQDPATVKEAVGGGNR